MTKNMCLVLPVLLFLTYFSVIQGVAFRSLDSAPVKQNWEISSRFERVHFDAASKLHFLHPSVRFKFESNGMCDLRLMARDIACLCYVRHSVKSLSDKSRLACNNLFGHGLASLHTNCASYSRNNQKNLIDASLHGIEEKRLATCTRDFMARVPEAHLPDLIVHGNCIRVEICICVRWFSLFCTPTPSPTRSPIPSPTATAASSPAPPKPSPFVRIVTDPME